VQAVLAEIDADEHPVLEVYNKIDLLESAPRIDRDETESRSASGSVR
jgi:GTP-binding protein HflX